MQVFFRLDDVVRSFPGATLQRARDYYKLRHVEKLTISDDGETISGAVRGTEHKPYTQIISVARTQQGRARFDSSCSCPIGGGCKHVAAVLLKALDQAVSSTPLVPVVVKASTPPVVQPVLTPQPASLSLSPELMRWLERAAQAAQPKAPEAVNGPELRQLVYVLKVQPAAASNSGACAVICPTFIRTRKDGTIVEQRPYDLEQLARSNSNLPKYFPHDDMDLLRDLIRLKYSNAPNQTDVVLPVNAFGLRVLTDALATGRLHWNNAAGPVMARGLAQPAEAKWVAADGGAQQLTFVHAPVDGNAVPPAPFDALLPLAPPQYVDLLRSQIGPLTTDMPLALAIEVARAPVLSAPQSIVMRELMVRRLTPHNNAATAQNANQPTSGEQAGPIAPVLPLPDAAANVETRDIVPVPRLDLFVAEARIKPALTWYAADPRHRGTFKVPLARLSFKYDTHVIAQSDAAVCLQEKRGDTLVLIPRDTQAEAKAAQIVSQQLNLRPITDAPFDVLKPADGSLFIAPPGRHQVHELARIFDDQDRYFAFSTQTVPHLVQSGWEIAYAADYPFRLAEGDISWWADAGEGSGIDWFSFELGIEFEGKRINLIPTLAEMLGNLPPEIAAKAHGEGSDEDWVKICSKYKFYHQLADGRMLPLPGARVAPIVRALIQLVGPRHGDLASGKVKLHRADAAALSAFAGAAGADVAWAASAKRLIELGDRLRGLATAKLRQITVADTFKADLRPYQMEGLQWLSFLRESGFGGALADDMGLGKTVQALAFLTHEQAEGRLKQPVLIVAPTSVLPNWKAEAERFAPSLSVLSLHGPDRAQHFGDIKKHDVILTTYPLLARDAPTLLKTKFYAVILDEAQAIKNPKATITGIAHQLQAKHRFALTGTPLENNLGEVWSLFQFLAPGLLGDESSFRRNFRNPIEKQGDRAAQAFLSRRLKPFMLRRTKDVVAKELPPKTEIIEHVTLHGAQRDLYETVRALMDKKVRDAIDKKGLAQSHIVFLDALLKLRQVCCDPRLLKLPAARRVRTSAKLERLMEMIPEMLGNGRRILVFSQFTSMLDLIEEELRRRRIEWVKIVGDTTDRETPVKSFQSGKVPLFLLSLKAGGTGLNLTAADTVIHYDPWWNPAVENQATDRAHRIGQTKPVFVHKLIVEEGIEQAIELLKARKAALAAALFAGDSSAPLDLTEADIHALLAPLSEIPEAIAA